MLTLPLSCLELLVESSVLSHPRTINDPAACGRGNASLKGGKRFLTPFPSPLGSDEDGLKYRPGSEVVGKCGTRRMKLYDNICLVCERPILASQKQGGTSDHY